jgi:protoporphyrinogen oxidase
MLKNDALDPLHYVKKYLLIDQAPDFMHTHEAREAIPTYPVNFQRKLHMLTSALSPNIRLLGMDTGSLSVTDCIEKSLLLQ